MTEARLQEIRRIVCACLIRYRDHQEWDDLVQEAWIAAWQGVVADRGEANWSTRAWNAAHWAGIHFWRARSLRRTGYRQDGHWHYRPCPEMVGLEEWAPPVEPDPAPLVIGRILGHQLWEWARANLTPPCWRALVLIEGRQMTYREAGGRLGVSGNAVKQNHRRALGYLAAYLGDPEPLEKEARRWRARKGGGGPPG